MDVVKRGRRRTDNRSPPADVIGSAEEARIGDAYQAIIPPLGDKNEVPPVLPKLSPELKWDPTRVPQDVVADYLEMTQVFFCGPGYSEEAALDRLREHVYDVRKAAQSMVYSPPLKLDTQESWTEHEKATFRAIIGKHGKVFRLIRAHIGTKSLGSVIHYYYRWKRTDDYKEWVRLDRKRRHRRRQQPSTTAQ